MANSAKLLTGEEIEIKLGIVPSWERVGNSIRCYKKLENFMACLKFANKVGALAEEMDHHPDILIHKYRSVTLTLTTHDAGGLTSLDFELARQIDAIPA